MALSAARSADLALAFERIDANNARAFAPLAVAFGQGRLGHALDGLIGIGARVDSAPVALFLAQPASHAPTIASLLTLNVAPAWRRRGIATKLLAAGEAAVGAAGCTTVTSMIAYGSPEGPAAQALAARAGWEQVQHLRTYFKVAYDAIGVAPWVTRRQRWPAGFDVVSFSAITGEERRQLMARQNDPDGPLVYYFLASGPEEP